MCSSQLARYYKGIVGNDAPYRVCDVRDCRATLVCDNGYITMWASLGIEDEAQDEVRDYLCLF